MAWQWMRWESCVTPEGSFDCHLHLCVNCCTASLLKLNVCSNMKYLPQTSYTSRRIKTKTRHTPQTTGSYHDTQLPMVHIFDLMMKIRWSTTMFTTTKGEMGKLKTCSPLYRYIFSRNSFPFIICCDFTRQRLLASHVLLLIIDAYRKHWSNRSNTGIFNYIHYFINIEN